MKVRLTSLQKNLCNELQHGLPVCNRPFARLAARLRSNEDTILKQCRLLKRRGVIRRIGAVVNHRVLGLYGTLVAAHVPANRLKTVVREINSMEGVSHNYLRKHYYNIWFTLQCRSQLSVDDTLSRLSAKAGVMFHSLPVVRAFKLDVRFDADSAGRRMLKGNAKTPQRKVVRTSAIQKRLLAELAKRLPIDAEPFRLLCRGREKAADVLAETAKLVRNGAVRRIAAIVDHHKLGFAANALFVCATKPGRARRTGKALAKVEIVSHCYQRKPFAGWPYNLFAMMHGRTMPYIQRIAGQFAKQEAIESYELLATVKELKKQPLRLDADNL